MVTIVNNQKPESEENSSPTSLVLIVVVIIIFVLFLYYVANGLRSSLTVPKVQIPSKIDVNVNTQK